MVACGVGGSLLDYFWPDFPPTVRFHPPAARIALWKRATLQAVRRVSPEQPALSTSIFSPVDGTGAPPSQDGW